MVGGRFGRFVCLALLLTMVVPLGAASRSRTATATVTIAALAKLSLSASALSFPDADPDTTPSISAGGGPVTLVAKIRTTPGSPVSLSVLASDDLRSGVSTIAIAALRWTSSGAGFSAGTMSRTVAQSVGAWVGSGMRTGAQSYSLTNSWTYAAGSYSTSLVYTLTAP
jgi:hypothetical protein